LEKAPWISCLSAIGFSRARHTAVLQSLEDLEPLRVTPLLLHGKCQFAMPEPPVPSIYVFNQLRGN